MGRAERRRRMRMVRRRLATTLMPRLGIPLVRVLSRSWKMQVIGEENWQAACEGAGMLVTLWHGRMVLAIPAGADRGLSVLVSPSGDGLLVPPILESFGYTWILGSTNKNPARAVREMLDRLRSGGRIVITPDGPRGPRHSVNPGPVWMARETGFPILPVGLVTDRAWHLKSWDAFTIPKWGARVLVHYGERVFVGRDADAAELERATALVRERMIQAEEEGFRRLGVAPDW